MTPILSLYANDRILSPPQKTPITSLPAYHCPTCQQPQFKNLCLLLLTVFYSFNRQKLFRFFFFPFSLTSQCIQSRKSCPDSHESYISRKNDQENLMITWKFIHLESCSLSKTNKGKFENNGIFSGNLPENSGKPIPFGHPGKLRNTDAYFLAGRGLYAGKLGKTKYCFWKNMMRNSTKNNIPVHRFPEILISSRKISRQDPGKTRESPGKLTGKLSRVRRYAKIE